MTERRYALPELADIIADRLQKDAPRLVGVEREIFWDATTCELVVRRFIPVKEMPIATEASTALRS